MNMDDLYRNQLFLGLTLLQLILGTAAALSGLYLVMFYVSRRDQELRRHWRILASALNAFTIGLGWTCFLFALSTIGYELTSTINHPPLEALQTFGNLIVLQVASIFISFSAYWYALRYRSAMRGRVRAAYSSICRKLGLSRIAAVREWVPFQTPLEQYPELGDIPIYHSKKIHDYIIISQYGVYLVVLANLWVLTLMDVRLPLVALMTWAFFFIIDDWAIIADYSRAIGGRTFSSHRLRVTLLNLVLVVALLLTTLEAYGWLGRFVSFILVAIFLGWRYAWGRTAKEREEDVPQEERIIDLASPRK